MPVTDPALAVVPHECADPRRREYFEGRFSFQPLDFGQQRQIAFASFRRGGDFGYQVQHAVFNLPIFDSRK